MRGLFGSIHQLSIYLFYPWPLLFYETTLFLTACFDIYFLSKIIFFNAIKLHLTKTQTPPQIPRTKDWSLYWGVNVFFDFSSKNHSKCLIFYFFKNFKQCVFVYLQNYHLISRLWRWSWKDWEQFEKNKLFLLWPLCPSPYHVFPLHTWNIWWKIPKKILKNFNRIFFTTFLVLPNCTTATNPSQLSPLFYPFSEGQGRPLPLWPWSVRDAAHRSLLATPSLSTSAPL